MDLVIVDRVAPEYAADIALLLSDSGLHPMYDDLPRLIVHNNIPTIQSRTAIYVPADEADEARQILTAYYEESHSLRSERLKKLPAWGQGFRVPGLISFGIGALVAISNRDPIMGLGVWMIAFLLIIQAMTWRRNH